MNRWRSYWNTAPNVLSDDPFKQVGKTVRGQAVTRRQLSIMVRSIVDHLALRPADRVLDLGCGNGMITEQVAQHCSSLVAVDFSVPLIANARSQHSGAHIDYLEADVTDLPTGILCDRFDKIYMQEALQHLDEAGLSRLLGSLTRSASHEAPLFFGAVPDAMGLRRFYDTPERYAEYQRRLSLGTEAIGTWWDQDRLAVIARLNGYATRFLPQDEALHTAHYRFDMLCVPQADAR